MFAKLFCAEPTRLFSNRSEAGKLLAARLVAYAQDSETIVLALPRGGVAVGFEVAEALGAPLDIYLVRKLGVPGREELAMGAIGTGNVIVLQQDVLHAFAIPPAVVDAAIHEAHQELQRREQVFRGSRPALNLTGQTVLLVDDGLATGSTMRVAVAAVKQQQPKRMVVAVPVSPAQSYRKLRSEVDELVCLETPSSFVAVGLFYHDFPELSDAEVREVLARAAGFRECHGEAWKRLL